MARDQLTFRTALDWSRDWSRPLKGGRDGTNQSLDPGDQSGPVGPIARWRRLGAQPLQADLSSFLKVLRALRGAGKGGMK